MTEMFLNSVAFNRYIGNWDMSNVVSINAMFAGASAFNQDIGDWNTSRVTDMRFVFRDASAFNQDIGNWNTSNVALMFRMFRSAVAFNQDISRWNTSSATDMREVFFRASAFDQNLGGWTLNSGVIMSGMLADSGLSVACYDATLIGWASDSRDPAVSGRTLGANGLVRSVASDAARSVLVDDRSWVISGDADGGTVTGPCVGAAAQIAVVGGDGQSATVGAVVGTAPSVRVSDANGNPVAGVSVTFAVASGGGTVDPAAAVITGADGVASAASWTLGTAAGSNTLTATVSGLTGSPLTFTATGTAAPVINPDPAPDSDSDPAPASDSAAAAPGSGPSLACLPAAPAVGDLVTCKVSSADVGVEILWRAAYNPVFAGAGVRIGDDGAGTFSFIVPAVAVGEELRVDLVGWAAPMSLGAVGGPVPSSVPAGEGTVGLFEAPRSLIVVLMAVVVAIAFVLPVERSDSPTRRLRWGAPGRVTSA
jgi:surface protein